MPVSSEQVAALRAYLAQDFEEYERLVEVLQAGQGWPGYATLLGAAFFEAVDRRFSKGYDLADIIRFVGDARARFEQTGTDIDPAAAERLIRSALGEGEVDDLDDRTVLKVETVLTPALIADEHLGTAELDDFINQARKLADSWLAEDNA